MRDSGLAEDMRAQRVALVAWSLPSDLGWIRAVPTGIVQAREPEPGTLAPAFLRTLARMRAYVAATGLKTVLTPADVDACIAGDAGIVLASEGTDFLEGRLDTPVFAPHIEMNRLICETFRIGMIPAMIETRTKNPWL